MAVRVRFATRLLRNESNPVSWKFPKIVAAQRLQTLLLITALVAVVMGCLLMSDLVRTFRTTVISDANKSLSNAVRELVDAEIAWTANSNRRRRPRHRRT